MPLYKRTYSPGQLQFMSTSTYRWAPLFLSERFCGCFVQRIEEVLNYMHDNAVKRGLVSAPGDWPRSSWRFYFLQDESILRVDRLQ
jgi:hypothetical protein